MEFRARWDKTAECYIIFCDGREIGRTPDVEGIGPIIQFWKEENE